MITGLNQCLQGKVYFSFVFFFIYFCTSSLAMCRVSILLELCLAEGEENFVSAMRCHASAVSQLCVCV